MIQLQFLSVTESIDERGLLVDVSASEMSLIRDGIRYEEGSNETSNETIWDNPTKSQVHT